MTIKRDIDRKRMEEMEATKLVGGVLHVESVESIDDVKDDYHPGCFITLNDYNLTSIIDTFLYNGFEKEEILNMCIRMYGRVLDLFYDEQADQFYGFLGVR